MWISRAEHKKLVNESNFYFNSCVEKNVRISNLICLVGKLESELREVEERTAACETHEELVKQAFDMRGSEFCDGRSCRKCPMPNSFTGAVRCADFIEANPSEALEIMRKEVKP